MRTHIKARLCLWPGGSVCVCVCVVVVVVPVVGFPPVRFASLRVLLSLSWEVPHVNWAFSVVSRCFVRVRVGSRLPCLAFFLSVYLLRPALSEFGRGGGGGGGCRRCRHSLVLSCCCVFCCCLGVDLGRRVKLYLHGWFVQSS